MWWLRVRYPAPAMVVLLLLACDGTGVGAEREEPLDVQHWPVTNIGSLALRLPPSYRVSRESPADTLGAALVEGPDGARLTISPSGRRTFAITGLKCTIEPAGLLGLMRRDDDRQECTALLPEFVHYDTTPINPFPPPDRGQADLAEIAPRLIDCAGRCASFAKYVGRSERIGGHLAYIETAHITGGDRSEGTPYASRYELIARWQLDEQTWLVVHALARTEFAQREMLAAIRTLQFH